MGGMDPMGEGRENSPEQRGKSQGKTHLSPFSLSSSLSMKSRT